MYEQTYKFFKNDNSFDKFYFINKFKNNSKEFAIFAKIIECFENPTISSIFVEIIDDSIPCHYDELIMLTEESDSDSFEIACKILNKNMLLIPTEIQLTDSQKNGFDLAFNTIFKPLVDDLGSEIEVILDSDSELKKSVSEKVERILKSRNSNKEDYKSSELPSFEQKVIQPIFASKVDSDFGWKLDTSYLMKIQNVYQDSLSNGTILPLDVIESVLLSALKLE